MVEVDKYEEIPISKVKVLRNIRTRVEQEELPDFMGKDWDNAVPHKEIWAECLRVLKPGSFMFVMSAPRADCLSRMIDNIAEAGFIIAFTPIFWAYAQGFPKALNVSKAVDKKLGAERPTVPATGGLGGGSGNTVGSFTGECVDPEPITTEAKQLDGAYGGFQPKPAVEVIIVAMKDIAEATYTEQALKTGKGVTWLDKCRVPHAEEIRECERLPTSTYSAYAKRVGGQGFEGLAPSRTASPSEKGRFPANLIVSDNALDDGRITKGSAMPRKNPLTYNASSYMIPGGIFMSLHDDEGQFSRYFSLDEWWNAKIAELPIEIRRTYPFMITPKAQKDERNEGLDALPERPGGIREKGDFLEGHVTMHQNIHPTVKPVKLMAYLITLGTQQGDLVLDPFMGSGTTAVAARTISRDFIGFEITEDYWKIATERVRHYLAQKKLSETVEEAAEPAEKVEDEWGSLKDWGNIKPDTEEQP